MVNPFLTPVGGSRGQFTQPQNQFDFSGWGDRLGKIEEGIAGLTKQFNSFQKPGDVAPEYTGNAAPEPLEQTANAPDPLGGIESLVAEPTPPMGGLGGQQGPLFDPAPPGTVQLGAPQQTSIGDIYNAGLTPGESSWEQLQLGLPRQGENWAAPWLQGYQGSMNDINAIEDYRMSQIDQNVQGTVPRYLNTGSSSVPQQHQALQAGLVGRPNDLEQPIGGPTREQQLQALQTQSSLSGPTQQKIQQGIGALV